MEIHTTEQVQADIGGCRISYFIDPKVTINLQQPQQIVQAVVMMFSMVNALCREIVAIRARIPPSLEEAIQAAGLVSSGEPGPAAESPHPTAQARPAGLPTDEVGDDG